MSRGFTRTRHCRHNSFDRVARRVNSQANPGQPNDVHQFAIDQNVRLDTDEGTEGIHDSLCDADGDSPQTPGFRSNQFTFEDVQAAAKAADIGLTLRTQKNSLDFDGVTETMRNIQGISFGVGNAFTYAAWVKRFDLLNTFEHVILDSAGGSNDRIQFSAGAGGQPDGSPRFVIFDGSGNRIKDYFWTNANWPINVWTFWVFTWNGTALLGYLNGVLTAENVRNLDNAGSRSDATMRYLWPNTSPDAMAHRQLSAAWWNTVLTGPEVLEIFNAGVGGAFDLNTNSGNYASAPPRHWWRFGHRVSPNLGEDLGAHSALIDLEVDAIGMTDADIVLDAPP